MVVLSVDYGDKRTGIALCDPFEMLASPLLVITETEAEVLASKIVQLANEHCAGEIVIGLPRNMDGSFGFRSEAARSLGELIAEKCSLKVSFWDERLTTVSAHIALNENNVRGKKRKAVIDVLSAQIILQDYIDSKRK